MNKTLFYKDKPIFGLDIGFSSLKVMQIERDHHKRRVVGYGVAEFDSAIMQEGVIKDPEAIAKAVNKLMEKNLVGDITTNRVCLTIPAPRTFSRTVEFPKMSYKKLEEAVRQEAEQYIPLPIEDLYINFEIIREMDDTVELLVIATSRKVADSRSQLAALLGLETVALETTTSSSARLFVQAEDSDVPTILIDLGSVSSDITIYDQTMVVTGTVPGGGDSFNNLIMKNLKVTRQEAYIIKTKYGLGVSKKQKEITESLMPLLDQHIKEIRRMIRYYQDRFEDDRKIGQIVTMGGGANMPGLSEYLTSHLRLPVRMCDPWQKLDFGGLQPPNTIEKSMYITVAGLALMEPSEAFE